MAISSPQPAGPAMRRASYPTSARPERDHRDPAPGAPRGRNDTAGWAYERAIAAAIAEQQESRAVGRVLLFVRREFRDGGDAPSERSPLLSLAAEHAGICARGIEAGASRQRRDRSGITDGGRHMTAGVQENARTAASGGRTR